MRWGNCSRYPSIVPAEVISHWRSGTQDGNQRAMQRNEVIQSADPGPVAMDTGAGCRLPIKTQTFDREHQLAAPSPVIVARVQFQGGKSREAGMVCAGSMSSGANSSEWRGDTIGGETVWLNVQIDLPNMTRLRRTDPRSLAAVQRAKGALLYFRRNLMMRRRGIFPPLWFIMLSSCYLSVSMSWGVFGPF